MKAWLHIGTEKTGTTAVQRFLDLNRDTLRGAGVLVPASLGETNHRLLPAMVNDPDFIDDHFRQLGLLDPGARAAAQDRWREAFMTEVRRAGLPVCVISSEHLQSRLRRPAEVERLRELIQEMFEDIRVVLYIREPVATAVSLHSTAIKFGSTGIDLPPPDSGYFHNVINHAETIRRWESVFGRERMVVRLFENDTLLGGNVIDDFLDACALPRRPYVRPERLNESLSALGLDLMARFNRAVPLLTEDGRPNPRRKGAVRFFERHFSAGARYLPRPEKIRAYETVFAASNEWVRAQYFPDRATLFPPYVRAGEAGPRPSPGDMQRIADALIALWPGGEAGGGTRAGARAGTDTQPEG